MKYKNLSISGFGPHQGVRKYSFPSEPILISGDNKTGKTTIFDSIQWCIFGPKGSSRTLKDRSSIINEKARSASVTLLFEDDMDREVVISRKLTRSGSHSLSLSIDDQDIDGNITSLTKDIESIVGVDHKVFSVLSILASSPSTSVNQFITGRPSERRELLANIVDPFGAYSSANRAVKKQLRDRRKDASVAEGKVETLRSILDSKQPPEAMVESLSELESERSDIAAELRQLSYSQEESELISKREAVEREFKNRVIERQNLNKKLSATKQKKDSLSDEIDDLFVERDSLLDYSDRHDDANDELEELKQWEKEVYDYIKSKSGLYLSDAEKTREKCRTALSTARAVNDLVRTSSSGTCPLCGTHDVHIEKKHVSEIDTLVRNQNAAQKRIDAFHARDEMVSERMIEVSGINTEDNPYDRKVSEVDIRLDKLESSFNTIADTYREMLKKRSDITNEISSLNRQRGELSQSTDDNSRHDVLTEDLEELDDLINDKRLNDEEIARYHKEVADYEERLATAEEHLQWTRAVVEQLETLAVQTSPNGIVSEDISSYVDDVAQSANSLYSTYFTGVSSIDITLESDDGEPTCVIAADGRDLPTYSHGEQSRIIASVALSMLIVFYGKYSVWIPPMWDEPGISVDDDASIELTRMLVDMSTATERQGFIISRDEAHKSVEDITIIEPSSYKE